MEREQKEEEEEEEREKGEREEKRERGERREKERAPTCWFTPQMPLATWAGPGQNQEPGTPSGFPYG